MKLVRVVFITGLVCLSTFLSAQKTPKKATKASGSATSAANGKIVYMQSCLPCHQQDGGGVQNMNPPLIKTTYVLGDKDRLIKILLNGFNEDVEINGDTYSNAMPSFAHLTNQQIADVLTFVRNNFGNKAPSVTVADVNKLRPGK
ncbi:c-type cytochrome [Mucilaginibacter lacusdianchii]|uniref:c-type cytochrome n=1 Tax=Mucilaginibacter lacusdianchii TaxID=2684211 RepID=UPI00131C988B|nr:cytochrome c [Mucilaginibacter sp. JXJ CY 39]